MTTNDTTKTTTRREVEVAATNAINTIEETLKSIASHIQCMRNIAASKDLHWGNVGDMTRIADDLQAIEEILDENM